LSDNPKRDAAEAQLRKVQRVEDGKRAMSEYEANVEATRIKTERLRALRLARDAAMGGPPPKKAPVKAAKAPAKKKAKAVPLAGYLKDREDSGRSS
jgi:hypothetical protein